MRKVERLVNLIALLLDTHRPLTLEEVAELVPGYEASGESLRRMFERDKEELRRLGVPVERAPLDAWGSAEGYYIDPDAYGMPALDLSHEERAALALAAQVWSGVSRDPAAATGLAKLDLDPDAAPGAVRLDLHGETPLLATLLEAVSTRKRIVFGYRPPGRPSAERHLEPYALVHRRGTWYVVGRDADRQAQRSFRLSRITPAAARVERPGTRPDFEVPAAFDPRTVLPVHAGEHHDGPVAEVRAPEPAARLAELRGAERVGEPAADGRVLLRLPVGDREAFVDWANGNHVEIVAPPELRATARGRLERLLEVVG